MRLECLALFAVLHGLSHVAIAEPILQPRHLPAYGLLRREEPGELLSRLYRRQGCAENGISCPDGSCCPQGTSCGTDGSNTCHESLPRVKCSLPGQSLCYWGGRGGDKVYGCCNTGFLCAGAQDTGFCKDINQKVTDFVTVTEAAPSPSVITSIVTEGGETVLVTIGPEDASATPTESASSDDGSSDPVPTESTDATGTDSSPTNSNDALAAGGASSTSSSDGAGSSGSEKKSETNIGAIVGGVIGGVAIILLFAFGILWMKRRDRQNAANPPVPPSAVGPASMAYAGGSDGGQSHYYGPPGYQQNGYNENGIKELPGNERTSGGTVPTGGYPIQNSGLPPNSTYSELDGSPSPGTGGGYPPPPSNHWHQR